MRSSGGRFFIVGLLALFMFIPLFFAGEVISDRARYSEDAAESIGREWGGPQTLRGPQLELPVREVKRVTQRVPLTDPQTGAPLLDPATGQGRVQVTTKEEDVAKDPIYLLPRSFQAELDTETEIRRRGIFEVPVYRAEAAIRFEFDLNEVEAQLIGDERIDWEQARLTFGVSSNRALRGDIVLREGQQDSLPLDPWSTGQGSGFSSEVGDPRKRGEYALSVAFQGAERLQIAPVGRISKVTLRSDWPHPSFDGAFLPDQSEITDDGFTARWTVPHLARAVPSVSRQSLLKNIGQEAFGFRFFQPNDFYQKAYRAARYGILFVGLTFLTVLLIEGSRDKPTHPVQYLLIGLVQSMFVVLMVAYAEQIGFLAAYLLASAAVVGLLTLYGWAGLGLGRRSLILGALLSVLYAVLFLILRSADFALLAGATLVFGALAGTMWATRNEDWYGPEKPNGPVWLRRAKQSATDGMPMPD